MSFTVYLAGPISGLSYRRAQNWRDQAAAALKPHGINALSPLRCKEFLSELPEIGPTGENYAHMSPLATPRGVMTRDRYDATRCDVLLVNLLGADRVSIGTVMEIAWADAKRTPIVLVMEERGNPHEHMMIAEAVGFRVKTLGDGLQCVTAIAGLSGFGGAA